MPWTTPSRARTGTVPRGSGPTRPIPRRVERQTPHNPPPNHLSPPHLETPIGDRGALVRYDRAVIVRHFRQLQPVDPGLSRIWPVLGFLMNCSPVQRLQNELQLSVDP